MSEMDDPLDARCLYCRRGAHTICRARYPELWAPCACVCRVDDGRD